MRRPLLSAAAASAIALGALTGVPAAADPGGSGCTLTGSADFTPNGPGVQQAFGYSLTGALVDCQSSREGAPTQGTIEVGQVVTVQVPVTLADGTVVQGTADYQEPLATGAGTLPVNSCAGSHTDADAVIRWGDGSTSVVTYGTDSVGPAVALQGTVTDSLTTTLVPGSQEPAGTAPSTHTISSTNTVVAVGEGVAGLVAFTTEHPDACTTESGISSVAVEGGVGVGSAE